MTGWYWKVKYVQNSDDSSVRGTVLRFQFEGLKVEADYCCFYSYKSYNFEFEMISFHLKQLHGLEMSVWPTWLLLVILWLGQDSLIKLTKMTNKFYKIYKIGRRPLVVRQVQSRILAVSQWCSWIRFSWIILLQSSLPQPWPFSVPVTGLQTCWVNWQSCMWIIL